MSEFQNSPAAGPGQGAAGQTPSPGPLPEDALILLPVRNVVLFPGLVLPFTVGRTRSVAAAQEAVRRSRPLGIIMQRDERVDDPQPEDLHETGTVAGVLRMLTGPEGAHNIVCQGQQRFRIKEWLQGYPFLAARVERIAEPATDSVEIRARFNHLREQALEGLRLMPQTPRELIQGVEGITSAATLADMVAAYLDLEPAQKQEVLEILDLGQRLDRVSALLSERLQVMRLTREISEKTQSSIDERQREYLLREQLRTIQKQLGDADDRSAEVEELSKAIEQAGMPPEVEEHARKELRRLERLPDAAAEHGIIRTYLETLADLPWSRTSASAIDVNRAREILDEEHYGLDKIKKRILEFLAVQKLNPQGRSPILCFVGPPGVGKTSLGQSIAHATDRKFQRISLGGVHDEAEIRGHRRTYIGAMPGNIIQAIRKAGTRDCVLMLDEIDKLGRGVQGDPSAALLEVLDPEQNGTFRDNYLGVPFDLSKVVFIATANVLDNVPGPLRDRMEVISLTGYTEEEKLQIAKRYLVAREREGNGLQPEQAEITDDAVRAIIGSYTREAGVRSLTRLVGAVFRNAAVRIASGETERVRVDAGHLAEILGPPRFENEVAMRTSVPGVATGLAWTPVGGDILFIEASRFPGSGRLILTGQLGDVMKESAQAALSLVKSRTRQLGLEAETLEKSDIHVHVPAGAIPKDGPSAGVAMYTALVSLLTDRAVASDVAMTGEISLRGLVLPVGGIKEKVTAAARAGIRKVLLPARNRRDYEDIPEDVRRSLQFVWLETVEDAARAAFDDQPEAKAGAA
ncbi:endopeptidase La [Arenibaculum pallidiluteum]|uniref:endopeptidase La n=1 Tax=Arenibaculum pallidiluteum TaxID=2812559 RepID=UPI001A95A410|nr:endopeptidase La [Arenibaculum pallidiluteum]